MSGEEVTMVTLKAHINIWLTDLQEPSGIFSYNINIDKGIMTPHWCLLRYPVTSRFLPWKTNNFQQFVASIFGAKNVRSVFVSTMQESVI